MHLKEMNALVCKVLFLLYYNELVHIHLQS